MLSRPNLQISS
uniref:Uncharacterized protein n=1 Tax=Arundo donax TaxID=35708 RepID=A0A0A9E7R3_ARUDO